ncbi:helix-turn-helix domain-containing protein [Microvirga lotononidis]|uniref:DNA-binding domain-containing protein, AraC-type n=1 Tax=Microvirga lotononidis TaxID=864069 RepID=I4YKC1_9HYPH|nr:AraC family transcriptional regulator [Microvirga lotononidis]EIM24413.1 DNA-binding domain-containing protein, AraC-type [Microvirga lotononidis]WQO31334.1 AraC family transcriptional regulator [Microvirga lotononidis]
MHQSGQNIRPLTAEVQRVLRVELLRDSCSATKIANLFAINRRALHRHLKAEGSSFRQVTNEVRCEIACWLLARSDLPVSHIAEVLNYAEISAFSRAFHRWTGQSPSVWRSTHRGPVG